MTITTHTTCDGCGEPIEEGDHLVMIGAGGRREDPSEPYGWERIEGYIGHYHATEARPCYTEVREAIRGLHITEKDEPAGGEVVELHIAR